MLMSNPAFGQLGTGTPIYTFLILVMMLLPPIRLTVS